jgi:large subunit ribosomal protein L22
MEAIAKTRHLKGSPRKARLVIDLIRGRNVSQALNILKFTDKRAAEPITKTLRSAIANATYLAEQQNIAIDPDDLFVKTCFVDMGAHKNRRRMRPAPQGRAFREQRHYCHITILVSSDVPVAKDEDVTRKKGKKLLAKESQGAEPKPKTPAKPKAEKKTAKTDSVKEESQLAAAPIAVEETKSAKAETVKSEQPIETPTAEVEAPQTVVETETPAVEEPKAEEIPKVEEIKEETPTVEEAKPETVQAEEAKEVAETEEVKVEEPEVEVKAETPKAEETVEAKSEAIESPEVPTETETAKVDEPKAEETVEVKADEPKAEVVAETKTKKSEDSDDILEVDSPKAAAKEKVEKQKAEASDAKNVQSQTPAERNETKKADDAQLDENDILELQ